MMGIEQLSPGLKYLIDLFSSLPFFLLCIITIILFYLILAFFTWSFVKPFKFLGVPAMISGIVFIGLRFSASLIVSGVLQSFPEAAKIVKKILPLLIDNILYGGIVCVAFGIIMVVVGSVLKKRLRKKEKVKEITINNLEDVVPDEKVLGKPKELPKVKEKTELPKVKDEAKEDIIIKEEPKENDDKNKDS